MKKIFGLSLLLIMFAPMVVLADTINNVTMKVYVNEDGSAEFTETWNVLANSGSEWYKQLYNLGNMEISDYSVMMDGKKMKYKDWDVNEGLSEKSGYYGINQVHDGIELCFGKGDYKEHNFTLKYKLSNFIFNTDDSQIVYFTLFPKNSMKSFSVEMSSYYEFPDDIDVWGYGYKGYAYVENGKIKMSNEGSLNNDYVVLLAKFPLNTFNTNNTVDEYRNFDDVYNKAEEGTFEYDYDDDESSNSGFLNNFLDFIFGILYVLIIPLVIFFFGFSVHSAGNKYGYKGNKVIDKKNVNNFRDIPCDKNIYYANALIKLNNFEYKESNILGSIILKWVREDKIGFSNQKTGIFNKETSVIDLTRNPSFDVDCEMKLFDMMYKASKDGLLTPNEFEKWCRKNYDDFLSLFKRITDDEINKLKDDGHIYKRTSKEECKKKNVLDDKIYDDSVKLYGLKLYLKEFSRMDTKEVMEVKLWDEYLMFAYLFGIADKVAKQLRNMYPEIYEQGNFDYDTFIFINSMTTSSVRAATSARSAAESYSAGGGGFSSGGGGGGSFGGGGSMGGR